MVVMYAPQGVGVRSALAVHLPGMKNRRGGFYFSFIGNCRHLLTHGCTVLGGVGVCVWCGGGAGSKG